MNETIFWISLLVNFSGVIISYKVFGKTGLYSWLVISTIVANIEVIKCVDLFGMPLTLGNIAYGSIFLTCDVLNEIYGKKEAQKGVLMGFFALVGFILLTQIGLLFTPSADDFAHEPMKVIFSLTPRVCLSSACAYLISNTLDVHLYNFIKMKLPSDKLMWIRNNTSTIVSQCADTIIFTFLAFYNVFSLETVIKLCFTTFIIKILIAVCDTPFLYIAKGIYKKGLSDTESPN